MQKLTAGLLRARSCPSKYREAFIVTAIVGMALAMTVPLHAENFRCPTGDVQCLIAAINQANANGQPVNTIRLEAGAYTLTNIDNVTDGEPNGLPSIIGSMTISGAGADKTSIARASDAPAFRLFQVAASGNLTIDRVNLTGGVSFAGAISNGGIVNLIRSAVTQNSGGGPGALFNRGTANISQSTFAQNDGTGAGAIITFGNIQISQSRFTANTASHNAGAISMEGGTAFISTSTFDHNFADGSGAISLFSSTAERPVLVVTDSSFTDNTAFFLGLGGGIGIGSTGKVSVTNTTFARNVSAPVGGNGSAIANFGTLMLVNSTLAENTRSGPGNSSALFSGPDATTLLQNTIVAGNTTGDCAGPIQSLGNNLIGNPSGCNINLHLSDLVGDPGLDTFRDNGQPGNGHFPLLPSSRAIDASNDSVCPKKDQIGQPRQPHCDIGAIESRRTTPNND